MAEEITCESGCNAECSSVADGRTIYEIDSFGNLCGCGASCTAMCGASCEGTSEGNIIIAGGKVLIADVYKSKYGDSEVTDGSKNKYT